MAGAGISAVRVLRNALAFTRGAWRRAWGIQALAAAGVALVFVSLRGRVPPSQAWDLWTIGWAVVAVTAAPLVGTLLRVRLGGAAQRCMGPAGLQFGMTELRLLTIAVAWVGATLLTVLPMVAISAACFVIFRDLGMVELPLLGSLRISFLMAAVFCLIVLGLYAYGLARLSLALPATVGKRRLVLVEAWRMSQGYAGPLIWGVIASLAPSLLLVAAAVELDALALQDPTWGAMSRWPLPDAILAGAVFGSVLSFIQAPLTLGVVAAVYCARRTREIRRTRIRNPVQNFPVRVLYPIPSSRA